MVCKRNYSKSRSVIFIGDFSGTKPKHVRNVWFKFAQNRFSGFGESIVKFFRLHNLEKIFPTPNQRCLHHTQCPLRIAKDLFLPI